MSRVPFSFIKSSGFDISTLNLTAWLRAGGTYNAATGTWAGTASAGNSGSHSFTQTTSGKRPTTGANLNGKSTVAFSRASSQFVSATPTSNFISTSAWSCWALINNTSTDTAGAKAAAYGNDGVIAESGSYWAGIALSTTNGGVAQVFQWDSAGHGAEQTLVDSAWSLVQAYYDGTTAYIRVNSGAWQPVTVGSIGSLTGSDLYIGTNYNTAKYLNGSLADVGISQTPFSQPTWDNIKARINSDYALSL